MIISLLHPQDSFASILLIAPLSQCSPLFASFFSDSLQTLHKLLSASCSMPLQFPPTNAPSFDTFSPASNSEISTSITNTLILTATMTLFLQLFSNSSQHQFHQLPKLLSISLFTGTFLSLLTFSIVSLLLEELTIDKEYLKNYHPISNHSIISKITERVFIIIINEHFNVHSVNLINVMLNYTYK